MVEDGENGEEMYKLDGRTVDQVVVCRIYEGWYYGGDVWGSAGIEGGKGGFCWAVGEVG